MSQNYSDLSIEDRLKSLDLKREIEANNVIRISNIKGALLNVRIVYDGDLYGKDFCLIHKNEEFGPTIELYSENQNLPMHPFGGFYSRYYVTTILKDGYYSDDMCYEGYYPDSCVIKKEQMNVIIDWLKNHNRVREELTKLGYSDLL